MPNNVDERVVQMRFDNAQFESGAKKTMSTLEELKKQSDMKNVKNGMRNFNTDQMTSALEKVKVSFDALEVVGKRVLENLTDSMYGFVSKTVRNFTIAPVEQGFKKFGDKTTAVATLAGQGYQLSVINEQLENLMWFSDETSYNFTDMVGNITKFTASGQELEPSVKAMEGIALWAATAGQNAATASRAMYQLSQAMSKGALKYDDYKSIQNANMDTIQFREKAAEAAVAVGTLKKKVDEAGNVIYKTTEMTAKAGQSFTLSELFSSDALSRTMWLSSDAMMDVFNEYSKGMEAIRQYMSDEGIDTFKTAVDDLINKAYEKAQETGVSMDEALKNMGYDVNMFALSAAKAGQETRTWGDVVDATMDAVSSGWMKTFELIFGTQKEATEFFSSIVEKFYNIFALGGEGRNAFFTSAFDDNITKAFAAASEAGFSAEDLEAKVRELAINSGKDVDLLEERFGSLTDAIRQGELSADFLKVALQDLWITGKQGSESADPEETIEKIKQLAHGDLGLDPQARKEMAETYGLTEKQLNMIDGWMRTDKTEAGKQRVHDYILEQLELSGALDKIGEKTGENVEYTEEQTAAYKEAMQLLEQYDEVSGRTLLRESILNVLEAISQVLGAVREGFDAVFGSAEERGQRFKLVLIKIHEFTEKLKLNESALKGLTNIFTFLFGIIKKIGQVLKPFVSIIGAVFSTIGEVVGRFFSLFDKESKVFEEFSKAEGLFAKLKVILSPFGTLLDTIKEKLGDVWNNIQPIFDKIAGSSIMQSALGLLGDAVTDVGNAFQSLRDALSETEINVDSIKTVFDQLQQVLGLVFTALFGDPEELKERIGKAFDTISETLTDKVKKIQWDKIFEALKIGFVTAVLMKIMGLLDSMKSLTDTAKTWAESLKTPFVEMGNAIKRLSKAGTILIIAVAILALAGAIALLCRVDQDKFFNVALTLGILMAVMAKIAKNLGGAFSGNKFNLDHGLLAKINVIPTIMGALIGAAAVIFAAAYALKQVTALKPEQLITGVLAILGVLMSVALTLGLISKYAKNVDKSSATAILGIAGIVAAMGFALSQIKTSDTAAVQATMTGIVLAILGIAAVLYVAKGLKPSQIEALGTMFTKFGAAMLLMGVALAITKNIPPESAVTMALVALVLVVMVAALAAVSESLNTLKAGNVQKLASSILILAAAVLIITPALALLSLLDSGKVAIAAIAIALVMVAFAGAMKMMESVKPGQIIAAAVAFALIAAGVSVLIATITGLIVIMLALAYTVPWNDVLKKSDGMLKVFGKFALAGLALIPLAIVIALVGIGIMAFGIGCAAAAVGIGIFTLNLLFFSASIYLVSAAIPKLAEGLTALVKLISEHGSELLAVTLFVIGLIVTGMLMKKVQVAEAAAQMVVSILNAISQLGPQLIPVIAGILGMLLTAVLNFVAPLTEFLVLAIIRLVDGLSKSLRTHEAELFGAFNAIVGTLVEIAMKAAAQVFPMMAKFFLLMLKNFLPSIAGIIERFAGPIDDIVEGINNKMEDNKDKIDSIIDEVFMDENHKKETLQVDATVDTEITEGTTTDTTKPVTSTTTERNNDKREQLNARRENRVTTPVETAEAPVTVPAPVVDSEGIAENSEDAMRQMQEAMAGFAASGEGVEVDPASLLNFTSGNGTSIISVDQFTEAFSGGGNAGIDSLLNVFQSRTPELTASLGSMFDGFSETAAEVGTNAGTNATDATAIAMELGVPNVETASNVMKKAVESGPKEAATTSGTFGYQFDQGLALGMNNGSGFVVNAAYTLANNMKETLKKAWGINSPSRVAAEIAKRIPEGVAKGVKENTSLATDAAETMSGEVITAVSPIIASLAAIMDQDYSLQPTITPVVDMSNVVNASDGVSTLLSTGAMSMGLNSTVSHRIDGITSAAIAGNRNYTNDLQQLIAINRELLDSSRAGGNVYLSDGVIAGMVNRRLGVL